VPRVGSGHWCGTGQSCVARYLALRVHVLLRTQPKRLRTTAGVWHARAGGSKAPVHQLRIRLTEAEMPQMLVVNRKGEVSSEADPSSHV
jgi:hypothetical protein